MDTHQIITPVLHLLIITVYFSPYLHSVFVGCCLCISHTLHSLRHCRLHEFVFIK